MFITEGLKCLEMGLSECKDRCGITFLLYACLLIIPYCIEGNYDSHHSLLA